MVLGQELWEKVKTGYLGSTDEMFLASCFV